MGNLNKLKHLKKIFFISTDKTAYPSSLMGCSKKIMENEFEQISTKPGFMKHNGGVLFRKISKTNQRTYI